MSEERREFSGRSVDEAVATGLQTLGLRSNQVQIEVINKGSRGLFGIGSEPAVIRITPLTPAQPAAQSVVTQNIAGQSKSIIETSATSPDDSADPIAKASTPADDAPENELFSSSSSALSNEETVAQISEVTTTDLLVDSLITEVDEAEQEAETELASVEMLAKLVGLLGFSVTVEAVWKDGDDEHDKRVLWLEIHGRNLSTLIGRRGETLENIQYLLRMMVNQRLHRWNDIVVDVEQYRLRRAEQISQLANRLAEQALSAGRAMSLEPMPPNERRIVHMALRDHPYVYTQSSGDGERRKVYIVPKN